MASRKAGSYVADWVKLAHKVPASLRSEFGAFRTKHQNIKSSLEALPAKPPSLDWSVYKTKISKTGMVEAFQKAALAVTVPYPVDSVSKEVDAKAQEMSNEAKKAVESSQMRIASIQEKVDELKNMKPFEEMSCHDIFDKHPELEDELDEQIRRYQFDPNVDYLTLNRLERQAKGQK